MSFSIVRISEDRGILVSDRRAFSPDGRMNDDHRKILRLGNFFIARSGNGLVSELMAATLSGLIYGSTTMEVLDEKLRQFRTVFDPIYTLLPKESLAFCEGGAQLKGMGLIEGKIVGVSVNYCPGEGGFGVQILKQRGMIGSAVDGNRRLEKFLPILIRMVTRAAAMLDERRMVSIFGKLYYRLSKMDSTVSPVGDVIVLADDGTVTELSF
jgi:hypothetical protein